MRRCVHHKGIVAALALFLFMVSSAGAVSPAGAFFRSLVLPGWGQAAVGTRDRAAVFASVESFLLLSAGGFHTMSGIFEDDYRSLAATVAGANVDGKGRAYFRDLAFYDSRLQHNQVALVQDEEPVLYPIADDWQWPTTEDRQKYRDRFNRAKTMDQRVDYTLFVISINHLASAIDAARQAKRANRGDGTATQGRSSLRVLPLPDGGGRIEWSWRF